MNNRGKFNRMIELGEVKAIQMDILSAFDEFCEENHLKYSMACGTLLGAIRHKGYIPWDDDIDVYMLREDFDKLSIMFPKRYKNKYVLETMSRDKNWDRAFGKLCDDDTIFEEQANCKQVGVNIDIFPLDSIPDNDHEWERYNRKRLFILKLYMLKCYKPSNNDTFIRKFLSCLIHIVLAPIPKHVFCKCIDKMAKKYNNTETIRCFECVQGILQKKGFKKILFDRIVEFQFEDRHFKGFENYDEYLSNAFGDYMCLPPVEKRTTHHNWVAYWK